MPSREQDADVRTFIDFYFVIVCFPFFTVVFLRSVYLLQICIALMRGDYPFLTLLAKTFMLSGHVALLPQTERELPWRRRKSTRTQTSACMRGA